MFAAIANTFSNCFKIPELKSRILFTLMLLAICRVVAWIPVPGLDASALKAYFDANADKVGGSLLGMYSLFTGGALQNCAIGSLGIADYNSMQNFGLILTIASAAVFTVMSLRRYFRYWLVRLIFEQRDQTDRLIDR